MEGLSHRRLHNRMANLAKRQTTRDSVVTEGGTVFSVVYVTAEPTFTGVIGGYTTLTDDAAATTNSFPAAVTQASGEVELSTAPTETVFGATESQSTSQRATATLTTPAIRSSTNTSPTSAVAGANSTAGSNASSSSSSDGGMSTGAKAGIAIGVIAVVGVIALILLCLLGKKKKQRQAQANKDNEKSSYGAGAAASTPPTEMIDRRQINEDAPRLSLRPVSRMLPEFIGAGNKARTSNGNMLDTIGESQNGQARNMSPTPHSRGPTPTQRQTDNPFADPQNPFADPEKPTLVPAPLSITSGTTKSAPTALAPSAAGAAAAAAAAAAVAVAATVAAPKGREAHPTTTGMPTAGPGLAASASDVAPPETATAAPSSMPSSPVTPAPVVATGPGPESSQGNVYRVMMDFKPSMQDELELVSGQLVRLLFEYDDGWALCIKLDRSQQGVVPRTCLAAKPSKPKPSHLNQYSNGQQAMRPLPGAAPPRAMSPSGNYGPPRQQGGPPYSRAMSPAGRPGQRPMSPAGRPGQRPMSPAGRPGSRPMSPAGRPMNAGRPMSPGPFNQAPRPLSPGPQPRPRRSMSPGPYGGRGGPAPMAGNQRRRSNSASALNVRDRRNTPPGPSNLRQGSTAQGAGIAL